MPGRVRKFFDLSGNEKLLFLEALFFQLTTGLILKLLPFRLIPRLFSNPSSLNSDPSHLTPHSSLLTPHLLSSEALAKEELTSHISYLIKEALRRSSSISPWINKCLVSSLAARCMLKRRKIHSDLYLGVAKNEAGKVIAHSWIIAGGIEIVPKGEGYVEMKKF